MAELLLINPARPPKGKRTMAKKRRRTAAQRRATARMIAANRARRRPARRVSRRRRNPIAGLGAVRRVSRRVMRRRRNPISLGRASSYVTLIKDALVGAAGAVAMNVAYGQINRYLPATLQRTPGTVGVGDAVKAVVTIALGKVLNRPTRGLSMQAARGSLIVQAHEIIASFVPASMPMGYSVPANVVPISNRIGPNRVAAYTPPGQTPLLSAYTGAGVSPLLNGRNSVMAREAVIR
jgi:hypothetical protein